MVVKQNQDVLNNPGPRWGYAFICFVNRRLPWCLMHFLLATGSLIALCFMPAERRESRRFLSDALGRPSTWKDSWKHFTAFSAFLVRRFDAADGGETDFRPMDGARERIELLVKNGSQALHGTFHFGNADLMGFWLSRFDLIIRMVRFQVGNSSDLDWLEGRFGENVSFLWVNEPENMLFALKNAVAEGDSVALKCDRVQHSAKVEAFEFLGKQRRFPFTIYHLAILFDLPVMFSFGCPVGQKISEIYSTEAFYPIGSTKKEKLASARVHFQSTLDLLEGLVRQNPYQWFNFIDGLPVVEDATISTPPASNR